MYLILAFHIVGCGGVSDFLQENTATRIVTGVSEKERRQKILMSDRLQLRAKEYEKSGQIYGALLGWQVLSILNPEDQDYAARFRQLKYESQLAANRHFETGKRDFNNNSFDSARQEFLIALRYNPDHPEALNYLKNKMSPEITSRYQVQKGDSLASIAEKVYQDPDKYYLIAVYNNLDADQPLIAGKNLKLPVLEPGLALPLVDITRELKNVRKLFLSREYEKVLQRTAGVLSIDPSNSEAADLKNAALYQIAARLRQNRNYIESLEILNKMDPRYKGVQKDVAEIKVLLKKQAEENYRIGVSYFVKEEIDKAIEAWEKTLILDPQHPKAGQDIEKARRLLKKLKEVDEHPA
ncbi:MAG: tetratricopeptide repeat protein [Desulfobacterales bacterium]|nr:MAG: tetratricopeptide repeat protein [Desulfobacterales bacterium]